MKHTFGEIDGETVGFGVGSGVGYCVGKLITRAQNWHSKCQVITVIDFDRSALESVKCSPTICQCLVFVSFVYCASYSPKHCFYPGNLIFFANILVFS